MILKLIYCMAREGALHEPIATQYSLVEEMKQSAHLLVVEDNPVNQKMVQLMLKKAGYQSTVAKNGAIAVELYRQYPNRFDLIFMDMQMPVMGGLTATATIRHFESSHSRSVGNPRHVPIIAMTANAMPGDREKYLAAGMDDYVAKPIKREAVFAALRARVINRIIQQKGAANLQQLMDPPNPHLTEGL